MRKAYKRKIVVWIGDKLDEYLEYLVEQRGDSMSEVVRDILRDSLDEWMSGWGSTRKQR